MNANHERTIEQAPVSIDGVLSMGAHLVVRRRGYAHHGIYAGNGRVVHYAGFACFGRRGPVEEISLAAFASGQPVVVDAGQSARFDSDEIVLRARSRIGEDRYRLLTNNCEHFCSWCRDGRSRSNQVRDGWRHPARGLNTLCCLAAAWWRANGMRADACITGGAFVKNGRALAN